MYVHGYRAPVRAMTIKLDDPKGCQAGCIQTDTDLAIDINVRPLLGIQALSVI